jgi:UDP-MurNAc hydroxylase
VRITGTGHASMRIETGAGSILCDPWVNPAYFASWFPFPDNSHLDWESLGQTDYLYVSHLHRDHFDAEHLRRFVTKKATVLLPEYPTSELEDQLRELGFTSFIKTVSNEVVELDGGLRVMIQALTSPTDGPIGDSSLWVEYDGVRLLNQNDARPTDLSPFADLGHVHAHLLQFSGAIWYPMVYELPDAAKTAFGKQKRDRQFDRTFRYIDDLKASWVFPIAGPPCFLDEELWQFNDIHGDEGNIFPDQQVFVDTYPGTNAVVLLPGTVATVGEQGCEVTQPVEDVRAFFANKEQHLVEYAQRQRPVIEALKLTWRHPEIDVLKELKRRVEPLLEESIYLAKGVGGPVRLDLVSYDGASVESIVVDFPEKEVRRYADEKVRYRFRTERALVEHLLFLEEVDWVNSLFLSCRFSAARIGQYNEFVYAFFKCLSEERLQYAEGWYDEHERHTDIEDVTLGDWVVQRRCPHLKADLTRFGIVDDGTLTCQLHGWKFDLASGRCLTSVGHQIRARKEDQTAPN